MERIPVLTLTVGLPGSGKSTWALAEQAARPSEVRIVCRDDIRAMCGTRFEDGDEKVVARIRDQMIAEWLMAGYDVILADTNISAKVRKQIVMMARMHFPYAESIEIREQWFDTPLEECIARNNVRWANGDKKVPNHAIVGMYEQMTANQPKTES